MEHQLLMRFLLTDAPQSKELQEDAGLAKGQDLQRAGLVQRLADLQAQEDRLQVCCCRICTCTALPEDILMSGALAGCSLG